MALKPRKQRKSYINITIKNGLIKALRNNFMIYDDGELWFYKNIKSLKIINNYIPFRHEFNYHEIELLDFKVEQWLKVNIDNGLIEKVKINTHDYLKGFGTKYYESRLHDAYILSARFK